MNDLYRLMFFKYLYSQLNLHDYETQLKKNSIDAITNEFLMCQEEKVCSECSKYFYLLNNIDLNSLTNKEKEYLNSIKKDSEPDELMINFFEYTGQRVLFANPRKIYGPSQDYYVEGNYIVLGLKYDELGFASRNLKKREEIENNNALVNDIIKKIESFSKYKIKVIKFNELFDKFNG